MSFSVCRGMYRPFTKTMSQTSIYYSVPSGFIRKYIISQTANLTEQRATKAAFISGYPNISPHLFIVEQSKLRLKYILNIM